MKPYFETDRGRLYHDDCLEMTKEDAVSHPWTVDEEDYTRLTAGVENPTSGFDPSVSLHQLSQMSERAKNERANASIAERNEERKKYDVAANEWKNGVWDAYLASRFNANDVFDTDAFYILSEKIGEQGIKMLSPFKLSQMDKEERAAYLEKIDTKAGRKTCRITNH